MAMDSLQCISVLSFFKKCVGLFGRALFSGVLMFLI